MTVMVSVKTLQPAFIARTVVAAGEDKDTATAAALGMGGPFQVVEEVVRAAHGSQPVPVEVTELPGGPGNTEGVPQGAELAGPTPT